MEEKLIKEAEFNPRIKTYILVVVGLIMFITVIGIPIMLIWFLGLGQNISKRYHQNLKCSLTNQHLEYRKGLFFKVEKTIPLENIQDLTFVQNPILNYFGLKILKIETAGGSGAGGADMKLMGIEDMEVFKKSVLNQREFLKHNNQSSSTDSISNQDSHAVLLEIRDLLVQLNEK